MYEGSRRIDVVLRWKIKYNTPEGMLKVELLEGGTK